MKQKSIFLLLLALLIFNRGNSQKEPLNEKTKIDTIKYVKRTEKYYWNDNRLQTYEMRPMLDRFSSSALEFNKYHNRALPATIIFLTGLVAGVIEFTQLNKKPFLNVYSITLFAGDIIGIPLMISAKRHFRKSVSLYNKEILK